MLIDLSKKYVDISQVNQLVQKIKCLKQQTYVTIRKMYRYNPLRNRYQQLAQIYSKCLDLQNKTPNEYLNETICQNRQYQNSYKVIDKEFDLFSKEACVINISLIQPVGIIKRASFSTQLIYGYSPSELIDKVIIENKSKIQIIYYLSINNNCNILIPDQFNQIHDFILSKLVSSGEMNRIIKGQLQVFGINKNGFAIPLNLRIKLDQSESNQFGASACFTQYNNQIYDFIIFSTSGNITNLTEKIYHQIFENLIPKSQARLCQKLDLLKILPTNQFQNKNKKLSIEYKSIFIIPQTEKALSILSYQQNQPFNIFFDFVNLCKIVENKDFKFYEIIFQVGKLQISYQNFELGFIQIQNLNQIKKKLEIQALFKEVKIQIEKIRQFWYLDLELNKQNSSFYDKQQEIDSQNIIHAVQFNQKQSLNEIKSNLSLQNQNYLTRPSLSSQISHVSTIKRLNLQNHFEFGSAVDHFELKQTEPVCEQFSNNQYLNANRKLLNNQDKCQNNNEITTEQSYDYQVNLFNSPISGRDKQNNIQESKLLLNDAILEIEKIDSIQNNQEGIFENIFKCECKDLETPNLFQQNYEIYEPQNSKNKSQNDQILQKFLSQNRAIKQNQSNNLKNTIEGFHKKNSNNQNQQQIQEIQNYEQNQSNSINSSISQFHTFKLTLKTAVTCRRERYEIMNEFVSIIAHTEYIKLYNKGIIQNILQQQEFITVTAEPLLIQEHFKNTVVNLEEYDRDTWYGQYIRSQYQSFVVFNQRNISSTMNLKMIFSFVSMAEYLFLYSQQQTEVYLRYIVRSNIYHYNQKNDIQIFKNMADLQKQEIESEINSMKSFQVISIIVLEVFTLLMAIQIIPIYFYIQYKKEQILKLFCTFQPNQLIERIQMLEYFINQDLLRDCPNFIISNTFINEFNFSSNELSLVYSFRGKAPLILAFNFLRQIATYEERPESLLYGLDGQLENALNYIRNTTNKVVQLLKNQSTQYLIQDQIFHRQIVELAINEDICSPLLNFQYKYLDRSYQIDLSDCSTIQNGIWNKGYLLGLQSLTNILVDFQEMYKASQTTNEFIQSLSLLYKENNGTYIVYQSILIFKSSSIDDRKFYHQ
ncbi:hypothetical protein ABPG72_019148 [Tetrahymena utriculariae]